MTDQASAAAQRQYSVEVEGDGCAHCGRGQMWTIVCPDGDAIGQSFENRELADDTCELLNDAFENGAKRALLAADPVQGAPAQLSECCDQVVAADERYCPQCGWEARLHTPLPSRVVPPEPPRDIAYRIEIEREDDGSYFADYTTGDRVEGGCGRYAATPIGALAELIATLIRVEEDKAHETRSPDGDGQRAMSAGVTSSDAFPRPIGGGPDADESAGVVSAVQADAGLHGSASWKPIAGSEPAESHTTMDRLLRQVRSASEGTTRSINDLGLAIERARETRPHADWLKETDERINQLPRVKHEGSDYISLTAVLLMIRRDSYSAAAGASPHARNRPTKSVEPAARDYRSVGVWCGACGIRLGSDHQNVGRRTNG